MLKQRPQNILAYRGNWLVKISKKYGLYWGLASIAGGIILWVLLLIAGGAFTGKSDLFQGGVHWQSLGLSLWESIIGVGVSLFLLVLFREKFNYQGSVARKLSANAFIFSALPFLLCAPRDLLHKLAHMAFICQFKISGYLFQTVSPAVYPLLD